MGMRKGKCGLGCKCMMAQKRNMTLANLPIGCKATILKVMPQMRGRKKFADVGLVPGTELLMEAHAPFGGLIRVKVLDTSMAMHRDDAQNIVMNDEEDDTKQASDPS
ncbi:MAG: FeoA family protein [Lentisphaeria bacterium]